jgi:hypothetical protein
LFWGGLDQICWIVNGIFNLGLTPKDWRKIGIAKKDFLKILDEKAPHIKTIFTENEFVKWVKILRELRHYVAHKGVAMPEKLYFEPPIEVTDEELDKEIEKTEEWKRIKQFSGEKMAEVFRPTLRFKKRLEKYESLSEVVIKIELDGKTSLIAPLVNINWDFDNFFVFASKIASECIKYLEKT